MKTKQAKGILAVVAKSSHSVTRHLLPKRRAAWIAALLLACIPSQSQANTYYWLGTTDANWGTGTDWNGGEPPLTGLTTSSNIIVFNAAPTAGNGTTNHLQLNVNYPAGQLGIIQFDGSAYTGSTGYMIDGTGTNALGASSVVIQGSFTGSGITETINAPLAEGEYATGTGTTLTYQNLTLFNYTPRVSNAAYTAANGFDNSGNLLDIGGPITYSDATASNNHAFTLTLGGLGDGEITGAITNSFTGASNTDSLGLTMDGPDTWTLTGGTTGNSYNGSTTINGGGTIVLNYTGTVANLIGNNGTPTSGNLLVLGNAAVSGSGTGTGSGGGGGNLTLNNNDSSSGQVIQGVAGITIKPGANHIAINSLNGGLTELNDTAATAAVALSRTTGSTLDVELSSATNSILKFSGTAPTLSTGIIGGWATVNGTDWATVTGGNYVAYTGYTSDAWASTNNTDVTTNDTIAAAATTNSLRFNSSTPFTVSLGAGDKINSGGILVSSNVGAHTVTIDAGTGGTGTLAPGTSNELILNQDDTLGTLNISAPIVLTNGQVLTVSGGGTVLLSGADVFTGTTTTYINQGTLMVGNTTALGAANGLATGGNVSKVVLDGQAILDLNGKSILISSVNDDLSDVAGGTVLAQEGLTDSIRNSAAGTISILGLEGVSTGTTITYSNFTGGLTEASGAILGISLGYNESLVIGTGQAGNGGNYGITSNLWGTNNNIISGAINVETGATLFLKDFTGLLTTGVLDLNGTTGMAGGQATTLATTYLAGTGSVNFTASGPSTLVINSAGSAADTFNGTLPAANEISIIVNGTGTVALPADATDYGALNVQGTGTVITPGMTNPAATYNGTVSLTGLPTLEITGTSGEVLGGGAANRGGDTLGNGLIWINPAYVSGTTAVAVTGMSGSTTGQYQFFLSGGGTLELSDNGNASVTLTLGSGSGETYTNGSAEIGIFNRSFAQGTLVVAAGDGLAHLGTTDKLNFYMPAADLPNALSAEQTNGIVNPYIVGQDSDANKTGAFLTYVGTTGTSSDAGFEVYTPSDVNFASATTTSTEQVTAAKSVTASSTVYSLEVDNNSIAANHAGVGDTGGTLSGVDSGVDSTGSIAIASGKSLSVGSGGLILNGGSITGAGTLTLSGSGEIYTSLAGGTIGSALTVGGNLSIFGPGVLTISPGTALTLNNTTTLEDLSLNNGVLDIAGVTLNSNILVELRGGVLESNGTFTRSLGAAAGNVLWGSPGGNPGGGGGFAAYNGSLTVALGGTGSPTALVWGGNSSSAQGSYFVGEGAVLAFGATNSNNYVNFVNSIDLGVIGELTAAPTGSVDGEYWREVAVTGAMGDSPNPFNVADAAILSGVISSTSTYHGLAISGNGVLALTNPGNTYVGATSIGGTASLLINSDTELGTAPTAAYALNVDGTNPDGTSTGIHGAAITSGAILINGGATLGIYGSGSPIVGYGGGNVTLSSNRNILLASGAYGSSPTAAANINVFTGTTASFGGQIGDYVGETGELNKAGNGTLNLSGANSYTGGTIVSAGQLNANSTTGSSTGSGSVNVASGAVLGGMGIIKPGTSTNGVVLQSGATMTPGAFSGSTVTNQMTLDNTGANATILNVMSGSNMVFSLGTGNTGIAFVTSAGSPTYGLVNTDSTFLKILGNTASELTFAGTGVVITVNDLTAGTGLQFYNNEAYLLISAASNADYAGIVTDTGTTGGVANNGFVKNVTLNGTATTDYNGLQLYLDNGDLLVVPEPGTWAMLLGGFAVLVGYQRQRRRDI